MALENYSIIRWITKHGIKTENGSPYSFKSHLFMYEPLQVLAKTELDVVVYKAAQIGFSTAAILATFWVAHNRKRDLIYTLPTMSDVKDFAGGKVNRIIAQNPILGEWVKEHDTVEQKTVGDNIIFYRGTFTSKAAMMVSSSLNAYDEVDASDQKVIEQYETRLQASEKKTRWYFSHPSVPGNGVSKHWEKSDQRHWFIKCPHCDEEQYMSYPGSFDMEAQEYMCKYCNGHLDKETRRQGRWVQKYKNKKMAGFWIPLWICPWVTAREIIEYHNEKSPEYFMNKVAGLPYVGSGNKPMYEMITKNVTDVINDQQGRIVIGCDTGLTQYYVVGNKKGLFYYGKSEGYDDVIGFMHRWPKAVIVFDAGGDLVKPREIREQFPGRVFLCHYSVDRKTMQLVRWGTGKEEGNVTADRNRMIQLSLDEFMDGRMPLQGTEDDWYDFWLHWNNIYRIQAENNLGIMERKWERSGDDHWVHAYNYFRIGMNRFGMGEGAIIGGDTSFASTGAEISPDNTVEIPTVIRKQINKVQMSNERAF